MLLGPAIFGDSMTNYEFQQLIDQGVKTIPDFLDKLCDALSVSRPTVQNWILGKRYPKKLAMEFVAGKIQLMIENASHG